MLQALLAKVPHYKSEVKKACGGHGRVVKAGLINEDSSSSEASGVRSSVASR